ncbi:MAG TPA: YqgE/AlgH family protein [Verrucomicrobiae bacterium]|nr:YqgE/AlgH family protein [Verrucomicrobiae bacterium]
MPFAFEHGESVAGLVLAASSNLLDPNFHRTLVYIAEHSPSGALGMVMNRPIHKTLGEVAQSPDLPDSLRTTPVFQGGPVRPTALLLARFQRGRTDEELLCQIVANPYELVEPRRRGWVRAFAGYAGWGEGQLERELSENSWVVCRPHTAMLEQPVPPAIWEAFVGKDQRWRKLIALLPKCTGLN